MCFVSGVIRSLRPLPWQATCAPVPRWVSAIVRAVSSETRRPVSMSSWIMVWSRRPIQVLVSGAVSSALISGLVRWVMIVRSWRLGGIASTRAIEAACSG